MAEGFAEWGQPVALCGAFWVAVVRFQGAHPGRFVLGLALGAAFAHVGWLALHADRVASAGGWLASPLRGLSVLFVPLGPALCACALGGSSRRWQFAGQAARALPLALACARVGCAVVGCCGGVRVADETVAWVSSASFGWAGSAFDGSYVVRHPTALYEAVGWLALHCAMRRIEQGTARPLAEPRVVALFAVGLGAIRLVVEPWRAPPPLGEPWIPVDSIAALWIAIGVGVGVAARGPSGTRSSWALRATSQRHSALAQSSYASGASTTPPSNVPGGDGVESSASFFEGKPRAGSVRHMRNVPRCRPSRS